MEKKDCVIGFASNYDWNTLKYWVNSLVKSGFSGDKVLLVGNCSADTIGKLQQQDIIVISVGIVNQYGDSVLNSDHAAHVERFFYLHEYLSKNDYRYVITTDVRDVIFQHNPIKYIQISSPENCIFVSESIRYKDEPWGNRNLLDTFGSYIYTLYKDEIIYNVGILAGTNESIKKLVLSIAMHSINRPIKICDQAVFNFLLWTSSADNILLQSEDGWACNLGTTADPMKINDFRSHLTEKTPILKNDMVCTSDGKEFYIVHQYDRVPAWRKVIESKYA